jgi:hypothetical protein
MIQLEGGKNLAAAVSTSLDIVAKMLKQRSVLAVGQDTVARLETQLFETLRYIATFDETDESFFSHNVHPDIWEGSATQEGYVARLALVASARYPVIGYEIGLEVVRYMMTDHCGCVRDKRLHLPEEDLYQRLQGEPDKLARLIRISWRKCEKCPFFAPFQEPKVPEPRHVLEVSRAPQRRKIATSMWWFSNMVSRFDEMVNRRLGYVARRGTGSMSRRERRLILVAARRVLKSQFPYEQVQKLVLDIARSDHQNRTTFVRAGEQRLERMRTQMHHLARL